MLQRKLKYLLIFLLVPSISLAAVTATNLQSGIDNTDGTSVITPSISTASSSALLLFVLATKTTTGNPNVPTLTGMGLTWVNIGTLLYDDTGTQKRMTAFRAMGSPTTGSLTADLAGQTNINFAWTLDQFNGVDTSGTNGSGAVVQISSSTNTTGGLKTNDATTTLVDFSATPDVTWGMAADGGESNAQVPGTGFTQLGEKNDIGVGQNDLAVLSEWLNGATTTVNVHLPGTSSEMGIFGAEIKAAASTPAPASSRKIRGIGVSR